MNHFKFYKIEGDFYEKTIASTRFKWVIFISELLILNQI